MRIPTKTSQKLYLIKYEELTSAIMIDGGFNESVRVFLHRNITGDNKDFWRTDVTCSLSNLTETTLPSGHEG